MTKPAVTIESLIVESFANASESTTNAELIFTTELSDLDKKQMKIIDKNTSGFRMMINPSLNVQRYAVLNDNRNLEYMIDTGIIPDIEFQKSILTRDTTYNIIRCLLAKKIELHSSVIETALTHEPAVIKQLINNNVYVSEEQFKSVLNKIPNSTLCDVLQSDILVSEKILLEIMCMFGYMYEYIKHRNPSEAVKLAAINNYPQAIYHMNNPSIELIRAAFKKEPLIIMSIKNVPEAEYIEHCKSTADFRYMTCDGKLNNLMHAAVKLYTNQIKYEAIRNITPDQVIILYPIVKEFGKTNPEIVERNELFSIVNIFVNANMTNDEIKKSFEYRDIMAEYFN